MRKQSEENRQMFNGFFDGKRVLVTGHTGFKGSWLALWLNELGASVTGLALAPHTKPNHFDLIGLIDLINHCVGDIRNFKTVQEAFAACKPEIVFHLAAQALVRDSYENPKGTFDTNIGGTVNVLEATRQCPTVKVVVVVTSDKCYENREWVWGYRENDPLGGHDPYSASKGATEIVCSAYLRSFFRKQESNPVLGFATVRAGNVIGGGDWARDRIIPDCVRALIKSESIVVRNPQATRPWQHVLDPLYGYLLLAKSLWQRPDRFSGAWNFGPGMWEQISVLNLVERCIAAWGNGTVETHKTNEMEPHEARLLMLNTDKAACELKWEPLLDSSSAIDWTIHWYKSWYERKTNLRDLSVSQICDLCKLTSKKEQVAPLEAS